MAEQNIDHLRTELLLLEMKVARLEKETIVLRKKTAQLTVQIGALLGGFIGFAIVLIILINLG